MWSSRFNQNLSKLFIKMHEGQYDAINSSERLLNGIAQGEREWVWNTTIIWSLDCPPSCSSYLWQRHLNTYTGGGRAYCPFQNKTRRCCCFQLPFSAKSEDQTTLTIQFLLLSFWLGSPPCFSHAPKGICFCALVAPGLTIVAVSLWLRYWRWCMAAFEWRYAAVAVLWLLRNCCWVMGGCSDLPICTMSTAVSLAGV